MIIRNRNRPSNILNLFSDTTSIHSYNTQSCSSNNVHIKKSRLDIQKRTFSRAGAKIWNEIPALLRELSLRVLRSVHSFLSLTVNVGSSAQVSSFKFQVTSLLLCHKTYQARRSSKYLRKLLQQGSPRKTTGLN